jgi:hypothetical protein
VPGWASFTEVALGVLSLPPSDCALDVLESNDEVVDFWLSGEFLEIFGDPDPAWRPSCNPGA